MVGCEAKAIGEYCETLIGKGFIPRNCSMTLGQNNVRYTPGECNKPTLSFWEVLKSLPSRFPFFKYCIVRCFRPSYLAACSLISF